MKKHIRSCLPLEFMDGKLVVIDSPFITGWIWGIPDPRYSVVRQSLIKIATRKLGL